MAAPRIVESLRELARANVEFVVVGMVSGVLQGAPVSTFDLDIVHRRTAENVDRLLLVLQRLQAVYRGDPRGLAPTKEHLFGPGHQLLATTMGDLDVLGTIDGERAYEDLVDAAEALDIGDGLAVRVLKLEELIGIKRRAGRPKDLAVIPLLQSTLDERKRSD
jgi:predicted nucleotidyltransferase